MSRVNVCGVAIGVVHALAEMYCHSTRAGRPLSSFSWRAEGARPRAGWCQAGTGGEHRRWATRHYPAAP